MRSRITRILLLLKVIFICVESVAGPNCYFICCKFVADLMLFEVEVVFLAFRGELNMLICSWLYLLKVFICRTFDLNFDTAHVSSYAVFPFTFFLTCFNSEVQSKRLHCSACSFINDFFV